MYHSHGREAPCPAEGTDESASEGDDTDNPPAAGAGIPAPREYAAGDFPVRSAIARHPSLRSCADFSGTGDVPDFLPARLRKELERQAGIFSRAAERGWS
jgi:hypothetical protein